MKLKILLILIFSCTMYAKASRVDTFYVESNCMNKSIPNLVILPDSYDSSEQDFRVVYLLHGAHGDFRSWLKKAPAIKEYADQYNYIIVCPDGGYTSWYFDSPVDAEMQYETYISKELISVVDQNYRTIENRSARAISGLSMGGHGAFYLAFKHQDIFGAAGSTSGGLDIRPFPNSWDISKRLGSYAENKENWENNSVINLVYLLDGKKLKLIFDCGFDDFFFDANMRMHKKLLERNIPHDFTARPGKHNNAYWSNSIKYQLLFFYDFFKHNE